MVIKLATDGWEVMVVCGNETGESNQIEEGREEKGREYREGGSSEGSKRNLIH